MKIRFTLDRIVSSLQRNEVRSAVSVPSPSMMRRSRRADQQGAAWTTGRSTVSLALTSTTALAGRTYWVIADFR